MLTPSPPSRTACRWCRGHGDRQTGAQHCSTSLRPQLLCVGTPLQAVAVGLPQPRLPGLVTSGVLRPGTLEAVDPTFPAYVHGSNC